MLNRLELMGDMPVTPLVARKLEALFGAPAENWLRLEADYRRRLAAEGRSGTALSMSPWATVLELSGGIGMTYEEVRAYIEGSD